MLNSVNVQVSHTALLNKTLLILVKKSKTKKVKRTCSVMICCIDHIVYTLYVLAISLHSGLNTDISQVGEVFHKSQRHDCQPAAAAGSSTVW